VASLCRRSQEAAGGELGVALELGGDAEYCEKSSNVEDLRDSAREARPAPPCCDRDAL
jgi:hypothetical protein